MRQPHKQNQSKISTQESPIPQSQAQSTYYQRHSRKTSNNSNILSPSLRNKYSEQNPSNLVDYKTLDAEIQEQFRNFIDPNEQFERKNAIIEDNNEQQTIYEQYLEMYRHYEQELRETKDSIAIVENEWEKEKDKVKVMEKTLNLKRKQLYQLRAQYQTCLKTQIQISNDNSDQLQALQKQLSRLKEQHNEKITMLDQQVKELEESNNELTLQLEGLEQMIESQGGAVSNEQYQLAVKKYDVEEQRLRQEVINLQKQSNQLRADIQKIVSTKPINTAIHRKYLDLYEKVVLHQSIKKAQQLAIIKQVQQLKTISLSNKRSVIEVKKQEVKLKEEALEEKNLVINELSQQIRDKSTMLLNIYQESPRR